MLLHYSFPPLRACGGGEGMGSLPWSGVKEREEITRPDLFAWTNSQKAFSQTDKWIFKLDLLWTFN